MSVKFGCDRAWFKRGEIRRSRQLAFCKVQLQYFADKGFDVTVLCPERPQECEWEVAQPQACFRSLMCQLTVRSLPPRDLLSLALVAHHAHASRHIHQCRDPQGRFLALGGFACVAERVPCRFYTSCLAGSRRSRGGSGADFSSMYAERLACRLPIAAVYAQPERAREGDCFGLTVWIERWFSCL